LRMLFVQLRIAKRTTTESKMSVAPRSAGAAVEQSAKSAEWTSGESKFATDIERIMYDDVIGRVMPDIGDWARELHYPRPSL